MNELFVFTVQTKMNTPVFLFTVETQMNKPFSVPCADQNEQAGPVHFAGGDAGGGFGGAGIQLFRAFRIVSLQPLRLQLLPLRRLQSWI